MLRLQGAFRAITIAVGGAVAPVLTDLLAEITPLIRQGANWLKQNRELVVLLFRIGKYIGIAGAALVVLGNAISYAGSALAITKTVLTVFGTALSTVFGLATSPIGLLVLAIGGLVVAFLYLTDAGGRLRSSFAGLWDSLKETAITAFGGIVDAIMAGNLELAWKISLQGLKVAWLQTLSALEAAWIRFAQTAVSDTSSFEAVLLSWVDSFLQGITTIRRAWADFRQDLAGTLALLTHVARLTGVPGVSAPFEQQAIEAFQARQSEADALRQQEREQANRPGLAQAGANQGRSAGLAGDLASAQDELARLRQQAAEARRRTAAGLAPRLGGGPGGAPDFGESRGTFSAFGVRDLGGTSIQIQQRDLLQQIVDRLVGIDRNLDEKIAQMFR